MGLSITQGVFGTGKEKERGGEVATYKTAPFKAGWVASF